MPASGQNYSCANLRAASFAGQSLPYADFSCANLFGADFSNANLVGAVFSGANLANSNFLGAVLTGADFSGANTANAKFGESPGSSPAPVPPNAPVPGTPEIVVEKAWATYSINDFVYQNNAEGIGHLPQGRDIKQSLRKRSLGSGTQYGWIWEWPEDFYSSVWAYPELIFGWKPWDLPNTPSADRTRSNTGKLPKRIADISNCVLKYDVELTVGSGSYNLAPEIWITEGGDDVDSTKIRTEVMFWLDFDGIDGAQQPTPAGADKGPITTLTSGGNEFELFVKDDMKSESPPANWRVLTYRIKKKPALSGVLPIHEFIRDGIQRGFIDNQHFLASVEFGNEVFSGTGALWIRNLSVDVS